MTDELHPGRPLTDWLAAVAAERPLPAGGHVASLVTAFAAGLVEKVARIVRNAPSRAALHALAEQALAKAAPLRPVLMALGDADDRAYARLMQIRRDGDEAAKAGARLGAARTQFELVGHAAEVAHLAATLEARVGPALRADLATARLLAVAAAQGAYGNVAANLGAMGGAEAERMRREAEAAVDGLP
jgi:formiminotetrahydrofolate cyclodeaminase